MLTVLNPDRPALTDIQPNAQPKPKRPDPSIPQLHLYNPAGNKLDVDVEDTPPPATRMRETNSPPVSRYHGQFHIRVGDDLFPMPAEMGLGPDDSFLVYNDITSLPQMEVYQEVRLPYTA